MNIFEAIEQVYMNTDETEMHPSAFFAMMELMNVATAYNALAPDWTQAPEWAQWYAIDCHNAAYWFDAPSPAITYDDETYDAPTWANDSLCKFAAHIELLPIGIDWRLCKWQRPTEVQP